MNKGLYPLHDKEIYMIIKSAANDRIKDIKKLISTSKHRKQRRLYVVEGIRMFREIPADELECVVVSEKAYENFKTDICMKVTGRNSEKYGITTETEKTKYENKLRYRENGNLDIDSELELESNPRILLVADHVFASLSDTVNPQGILALVRQQTYELTDIIRRSNSSVDEDIRIKNTEASSILIFILEHIQDPGNLGTIIRTAEAVGASLILSSDCADIYNPKVVRSTMGAIFRVPVYVSGNLATDIDTLKQKGICIYGTHLSGTEFYDEKFSSPSAFLIGNEGNGLSAEISTKADKLIKIPMLGSVESLNAATTVAVVGYEVLRQRR
jgi:TrmH family RNA methyltransferase